MRASVTISEGILSYCESGKLPNTSTGIIIRDAHFDFDDIVGDVIELEGPNDTIKHWNSVETHNMWLLEPDWTYKDKLASSADLVLILIRGESPVILAKNVVFE